MLLTNDKTEMIVISKGISFRYALKEKINKNELFEKQYTLIKEENVNVEEDNANLFKKAAGILNIVNKELEDKEIEPEVMKAFFSHCIAMLRRIENDNQIINPFHYETIALYKDAYYLTETISQKISAYLGYDLPQSEIDFLVLYIQSIYSEIDTSLVQKLNQITAEIIEMIELNSKFEIDKASIAYSRFITHIKFIVLRVVKKEDVPEFDFLSLILEHYSEYLPLEKRIKEIIERNLNTQLNEAEEAYIIMHLVKVNILPK